MNFRCAFLALLLTSATAAMTFGGTKAEFDHKGVCFVDGKPFFPIGLWIYDAGPKVLQDMQSKHFNCVVGNGFKASDLDHIHKAGFMFAPLVNDEIFAAAKNHPGLLAWFLTDEPEGHGESIEDVRKRYLDLKKKDPNHPIGIDHFLFDAFAKYKDCCDFTMSDNYPVTANRDVPLRNVGIHMAQIHVVHGNDWPAWPFIQTFGGPNTDGGKWAVPEPEEIRCMAFTALTQRATAMLYFSYWAQEPRMWASLEPLNRDIISLVPYLVCEAEEVAMKSDKEQIWTRARHFQNGWLILAVNTERSACDANLTVPGLGKTALTRALENRQRITPKDGVIHEKFGPCEVKVYAIGNPPRAVKFIPATQPAM